MAMYGSTLGATVRVAGMPATRRIAAVEQGPDGTWRVCGSGASDASGNATLMLQVSSQQSRVYALAVDEWGKAWAPSMTVAVGDTIRPSTFIGFLYRVTSAGQLPAAEPAWWSDAVQTPQPVGTAMLEAVRYYQPLAHGPIPLETSGLKLLDVFPGAALAFSSSRLLRGDYNGAALRVRRESDNTELDIGFVDGMLDETALLNFVGSGNGFVTKLYDQSGHGHHALQATVGKQPTIVQGGSIQRIGTAPAVRFNGSNSFLQVPALNLTATSQLSLWLAFRPLTTAMGIILESTVQFYGSTGTFMLDVSEVAAGAIGLGRRGSGSLPGGVHTAGRPGIPWSAVFAGVLDLAASGEETTVARVNGTTAGLSYSGQADTGLGPFGNHPLYIGMRAGTSYPYNGLLGEVVLHPGTAHAVTNALDLDLMAQHGVQP
jgi:hypothetical protein